MDPSPLIIPTRKPPMRLTKVVMMERMESPFTNLVAPSMEPKKSELL